MYIKLHGVTVQRTVILTVNPVIILFLTPGRSRKAPSNDGTVEHSDTERHDGTADASTTELG